MARITKSGQSVVRLADSDRTLSFNLSVEDDFGAALSAIPDTLQFKVVEMSELKLGFGDESDALYSSASTIDISLHFENVDGFEVYKVVAAQTESFDSQIILQGWQELMSIDAQSIKYDFVTNVFSATFELGKIEEEELELHALDSYPWCFKNVDNRYSVLKYENDEIAEVLAANVVYRSRWVSVRELVNYLVYGQPANKINFNLYRMRVDLSNGTAYDTSLRGWQDVYVELQTLLRDGKSYKQILSNILRAFSAKLVFSPLTGASFIPNWGYSSSQNVDSSRMISIEPFIISKKDKYLYNVDYVPFHSEVARLSSDFRAIDEKNRDLEDTQDFEKINIRLGCEPDPAFSNWVVYDYNRRVESGVTKFTRVAALKNSICFTNNLLNHTKSSLRLEELGALKKIYVDEYNNLINHAKNTSRPFTEGTAGFKVTLHGLFESAMHGTFKLFGKEHRVINLVLNYVDNTSELTLI